MSDALSRGTGSGVRDWFRFRGNDTTPEDWKSLVDQSGLPSEVCEVISKVLSHARLWRGEKLSVAGELIAHFQDGYDRGISYRELRLAFGDPETTAELIERSKERSRPLIMKITRIIAIVVALFLVAGLGTYLYFLSGQPVPDEDYLAWLNRPAIEALDQPCAWPIYRDAWIDCEFLRLDTKRMYAEDTGELARPEDAEWPAAQELLDECKPLLDAMREGSRLPALGLELKNNIDDYDILDRTALYPHYDPPPVDHEPVQEFGDNLVIGVLLPHVQGFQEAARLLQLDIRRAALEGDSDAVLENINAIFGIGAHANEHPILVCSIVAFGVDHRGYLAIEEIITQYPDLLSDEQLQQISANIAAINYRDYVQLEGERAMVLDILQHTYTDDGNGDGRITPEGLKSFFSLIPAMTTGPDESSSAGSSVGGFLTLAASSRKEMADSFEELIQLFEHSLDSPLYEVPLDEDARVDAVLQDGSAEDIVLGTLAPATSGVRASMERIRLRQSATLVALALELHQRSAGQYPGSIDQLVPERLVEVPRDRCVDGPLLLTFRDGAPVIYSAGIDGDDDGGVSHPRMTNENYTPSIETGADCDWILWPWIEKTPR